MAVVASADGAARYVRFSRVVSRGKDNMQALRPLYFGVGGLPLLAPNPLGMQYLCANGEFAVSPSLMQKTASVC